eukprot:scaffold518_cov388-Prasinococcus_capsulatus_cf.AAC.68
MNAETGACQRKANCQTPFESRRMHLVAGRRAAAGGRGAHALRRGACGAEARDVRHVLASVGAGVLLVLPQRGEERVIHPIEALHRRGVRQCNHNEKRPTVSEMPRSRVAAARR